MADDDQELRVNVTVSQTGAADAQKAVEGVKDAVQDAGEQGNLAGEGISKGFSGAGHTLREVLVDARHSHEVFEGISRAANGGVGGVLALTRGIRGLVVLISEGLGAAGPIGIAILALGALAGAFLSLSGKSKEAGADMKDAGDKAEDFAKKVEEASKVARDSFKGMLEDAKALVGEFERLDKIQSESEARDKKLDEAKRGLRDAQLDVQEQDSLAAAKPEDRQHLRDVFEARRKMAKLDDEARDSENTVLQAKAKADRAADEQQNASQQEQNALANQRDVEAKAADTVQKATQFNSSLLEHAKTGEPISEADAARGRELTKAGLAAQAGVKAGQGELDKVQKELGTARSNAEAAGGAYRDAQDLDAVTQKKVAAEKEALSKVTAAKADDEASEAAKRLAESLDKAAKAADKQEKKSDEESAKPAKETKADETKADEAEEHRDASAEHAIQRGTHASGRAAKALESHAKATERLAGTAEQAAGTAIRASKKVNLVDRQMVNEGSYNASP